MPHTTTAPEAMTNRSLRAYLYGLPGVDEVGAAARAKDLSTRSVKTTTKATAIDLAISMVDLTTLEGADTPGKVRALCTKAAHPDPADRTVPTVGAVCVYPDMVANAKSYPPLRDSGHYLITLLPDDLEKQFTDFLQKRNQGADTGPNDTATDDNDTAPDTGDSSAPPSDIPSSSEAAAPAA